MVSRYYETDKALQSHWKSKVHKRRCKQLREPAYTIEEAERAAGLGRENKRATAEQPASPSWNMQTDPRK
jgi:bud site selection protein 20